ncbi:hypothetical protein BIV60_07250 [Bacillus sp. MUM 116]|uniref:hypothetical protein n=1 Tax=Bacillus sp. MUM 116 TaxID=1678002 RepID=UPI0008F5B70C|nr:hypothetical protein [Bacillus sp. MUM 116]OIK15912.1 hypothetical protein BIV60_07250 [Bacillus sp. MUM 116]
MSMVLTYVVSLFVIVISVFITLLIKSELDRLFREKKDGVPFYKKNAVPFHICNVVIVLMVSFGANAVMAIYISGNEFSLIPQLVILMLFVLPFYILGHFAFKKYKFINRKYTRSENKKVLIINEKHLQGKKRPSRFKHYNALSKEK